MALTYAAPLVGATAVLAGLTAGTSLVAFYLDGEGRGRQFVTQAALIGVSTANATTAFPVVKAFLQGQDLSTAAVTGAGITLQLTFPALNLVDQSSPQVVYLDDDLIVGLVSGTF